MFEPGDARVWTVRLRSSTRCDCTPFDHARALRLDACLVGAGGLRAHRPTVQWLLSKFAQHDLQTVSLLPTLRVRIPPSGRGLVKQGVDKGPNDGQGMIERVRACE